MALSLARPPFSFTLPMQVNSWLLRGRNPTPALDRELAAQVEFSRVASSDVRRVNGAAWTAEEQNFLRALREAGL